MEELKLDRMRLLSLEGPTDLLDETLLRTADLLRYPPDASAARKNSFSDAEERNPFEKLLARIERIADNAGVALEKTEVRAITAQRAEIAAFIDSFGAEFSALRAQLDADERDKDQCENLMRHLSNLRGMRVRLEDLFSCKYIRARLGRLHADGERKLRYFTDHLFLYVPFNREGEYVWCAYLTPNESAAEVDNIFDALFFERVRIPDRISGTPAEAAAAMQKRYSELSAEYKLLCERFRRLVEENRARIVRFYNEARFLGRLYETRRFASIFSDRFYLTAFVARDSQKALEQALDGLEIKVQTLRP